MASIRVPAADCLHLFKPLAAGQLRGITWLAPVRPRFHGCIPHLTIEERKLLAEVAVKVVNAYPPVPIPKNRTSGAICLNQS